MRTILAGAALGLMLVALASTPVTSQGRGAAPKSGPDMKGPAPRLPNGKPSMTGVWDNTRRADVTNKAIPGFVKELPYTAWGKAKWMFHLVPTDGRPFTKDLPPSWFGESVGRWDGDTLVVDTVNINGFTRVDTIGHPMSARARITQTFKRVNFGTIEHTFTLTDPKTYTSPWTVHDTWALEPDTKLLEYACMENNRAFYEGRIKPFVPPDDVD